jgi:hypothetical protein
MDDFAHVQTRCKPPSTDILAWCMTSSEKPSGQFLGLIVMSH